mmetsp:Transcript_27200/g.66170  ORF Transcript_27200/g.66170 Transcript_27200/m.66170 type:complete len:142 (+) Transcript_27200:151-576(+)
MTLCVKEKMQLLFELQCGVNIVRAQRSLQFLSPTYALLCWRPWEKGMKNSTSPERVLQGKRHLPPLITHSCKFHDFLTILRAVKSKDYSDSIRRNSHKSHGSSMDSTHRQLASDSIFYLSQEGVCRRANPSEHSREEKRYS